MNYPQLYQLTPPTGTQFLAEIYEQNGLVHVRTNRTGEWQDEPELLADLLMPEQRLSNWDVTVINHEANKKKTGPPGNPMPKKE